MSAKQGLLADGGALDGLRIDRDPEAGSGQRWCPAPSAKRQIGGSQRLAYQMTVIRPFHVTQSGNTGSKVSAGRGQDGGLADLTAHLIADTMLAGILGQTQ